MEKTVSEVSALSGVSVRTLHYYDKIGLLKPGRLTDKGYRLYGEEEIERLMQILFFRELDFPLKDIARILDDTAFNRRRALEGHIELLTLRRDRLSNLISLAQDTLKGVNNMNFKAFDKTELEEARERYYDEAKKLWGDTSAWRESEEKMSGYGKDDFSRLQAEMDGILSRLAGLKEKGPGCPEALAAVAEWKSHIAKNYYECTNEILSGLSQMYVCDERFSNYLDGRYGEGAARFISEAMCEYCKKEGAK